MLVRRILYYIKTIYDKFFIFTTCLRFNVLLLLGKIEIWLFLMIILDELEMKYSY